MFGEALSELLDRAGALTHDREAIRTPIGPVHGYMDAAKACGSPRKYWDSDEAKLC